MASTRSAQGGTAKLLRDHCLRATAQRRVILEAFARGRGGHLNAADVCRRAQRVIPELARGTVYKCLGELVQAGLLRRIDVGESRLYDANLEPHEHFRCRECGRIDDIFPSGVDRIWLDGPALKVERVDVLITGLCTACAAKPQASPDVRSLEQP